MSIETIKAICTKCGGEFDAGVKVVLGWRFVAKVCPACSAHFLQEMDAQRMARESATEIEIRRNWLYTSGIPLSFRDKTFANFERKAQPKAYDACLKYAENFPQGRPTGYPSLALVSPNIWGVGKTHLAGAIAHHLFAHRPADVWRMCPVHFVTEHDLFTRIQATFATGAAETESGIINWLCIVPLLILDDLGKVPRRDPTFVQNTLFKIINGRYNNDLPMVVTANLDEARLGAYLGGEDNQASFDRLIEMCGGKLIGMKGESWRRVR